MPLEYRGYGLSTGQPSEKGLYIDGRAAVDYLFTRHDVDHSQIILFGRSLGGAIVSDSLIFKKLNLKRKCILLGDRYCSRSKLRH